ESSRRYAYDFVRMFLSLDRVEHECCNRCAGETTTCLGCGTLPAAIGGIVLLGETWRPCDRPVKTAILQDFVHGKRIAHVISQNKTDNAIWDAREMRCS